MSGYKFNNGAGLDIPDVKGDELIDWLERQEGDYLESPTTTFFIYNVIDKIRELQNDFYRPIVEC